MFHMQYTDNILTLKKIGGVTAALCVPIYMSVPYSALFSKCLIFKVLADLDQNKKIMHSN